MNSILDNDLFQAFSHSSDHVYIYVCDMKNSMSHWSKQAVEYFELPSEYMKDAGDIWMQRIHPEDRARYQEDIGRVFSGQSSHHCCEYRAMNRMGDYVWLECRGSVIKDEQGQDKVFAGMMTRLDAQNKYDPLTNLRTIHGFHEYDFSTGRGAVLMLGLDGFRDVINRFGWNFGNDVLRRFCQCASAFCRETGRLYRMEGDEFLIVVPNGSFDTAQQLFRDLQHEISKLCGQIVELSFSGGCVLYPEHGTHSASLLRNLEQALAHAKAHNRGRLTCYTAGVIAQRDRYLQLKQALVQAVNDDFAGFELYFQPLVSSRTFQSSSCEALLRWHNPNFPDVGISEVIEILETGGGIHSVGRWVAQRALSKAKTWQKSHPGFTIGFNVSSIQFLDPDFPDFLIRTAQQLQLNPSLVTVELTESACMKDFLTLSSAFTKLRAFGFKMALDDFGIGYSTLLVLRNLPADCIKIDQSFVRNLANHNNMDVQIIRSICDLCERLQLTVVAEGVENQQILSSLEDQPIDLFQGYYFSRPIPEKDFVPLTSYAKAILA